MSTLELPATTAAPSRPTLWAGRALSGLVILFMAMDTTMKLLDLEPVKQAAAGIGWPTSLDRTLGVIELVCLALYAVPRTAVLGAILTTGLLGGAVAAHLRSGDPLFSYVLFGVYVGLLAWGGLWLRDPQLRALLPIRR
jgi:DoxX-like family